MRSKKEKFKYFLYVILAKNLPISYHFPPAKKIRGFFGHIILKSHGKNINIEKGAIFNSQVSLGTNSGIGVNCEVYGPVTIGDNVMMGPDVVIYTNNHSTARTDITMIEQGYEEVKPVVIGNDVWIGKRVIILPGVTIGNGCVIGAGSIVTKDVSDFTVVAGNPATIIRVRK